MFAKAARTVEEATMIEKALKCWGDLLNDYRNENYW